MSASRPAVDVVVPFRGTREQMAEAAERLSQLRVEPGDSVLIVDNNPRTLPALPPDARVGTLAAPEPPTTPANARNRGAAQGSAEWILFLDSDVTPVPDLLDRYFEPLPGERTAMLAGGIFDEPVPPGGPPAARYAYIRKFMSQDDTLAPGGEWGFPKTANAAIRRSAFEAANGFRDELRAAEDSDLTIRLRAEGWGVERRERASAVHHSRQTVRGFIRQRLTHGAGGAWLEREWPGSCPSHRLPGLIWWGARSSVSGIVAAIRARDRDRAIWAVFDPLELIVHELGRWVPNERRS